MNPAALKDMLKLSAEERLALLRFGFELETQETNGMRGQEYFESTDGGSVPREFVDRALVQVEAGKYTQDNLKQALLARFDYYRYHPTVADFFFTELKLTSILELFELGIIDKEDLNLKYDGQWRRPFGYYVVNEVARDLYFANKDVDKTLLKSAADTRLEIGRDATVSGFEFRTVGGHPLNDALELTKSLLELNTHKIDDGCSYHIHVSLPGIFEPDTAPKPNPALDNDYEESDMYWARTATSNKAFGAQCMMSILDNIKEVPTAVLQRWSNPKARHNFAIAFGTGEKYEFVNWHSTGTIEFRCFGNVSTTKDAEACLKLAGNAIWDALENRYAITVPYLLPDDYEQLIDWSLNTIEIELLTRTVEAANG